MYNVNYFLHNMYIFYLTIILNLNIFIYMSKKIQLKHDCILFLRNILKYAVSKGYVLNDIIGDIDKFHPSSIKNDIILCTYQYNSRNTDCSCHIKIHYDKLCIEYLNFEPFRINYILPSKYTIIYYLEHCTLTSGKNTKNFVLQEIKNCIDYNISQCAAHSEYLKKISVLERLNNMNQDFE